MSLDSLAILVSVEEHFGITISDAEARNILTVQDLADCAFAKVTIDPTEKCKSQLLFYKFRSYFVEKHQIKGDQVRPDTRIEGLIRGDLRELWMDLSKYVKLNLPSLTDLDIHPEKDKDIKIFGLKVWTRRPPLIKSTIGELVNWTLSKNYSAWFDPKSLLNKSDVEKVVVGIISESVGIPVEEIQLKHRITYDLGID
jgi:hypothetical protein